MKLLLFHSTICKYICQIYFIFSTNVFTYLFIYDILFLARKTNKEAQFIMNLHTQVEQYLLELIQSGKLQPGDQIPTESELSAQFSASRPTVRQALSRLTLQGYLVRTKGKGSFVTQPKVLHESTTFLSGYRTELEKRNQEPVTHVLMLELANADIKVAENLHLPIGSKIIKLVRLRSVTNFNKGNPVLYTTVYVPYKRFPQMLEIDFSTTSFYETLAQNGYEVKHATRKLEVVLPDAEISKELKIGRFEPAIFISSTGRTISNEIIEYAESYYPAGCSQFLIEIHK